MNESPRPPAQQKTLDQIRKRNGAPTPPPIDSDETVLRSIVNRNGNKFHRAIETGDGTLDSPCPTNPKGWKKQARCVLGLFYEPCQYCYEVSE